MKHILIQLLVLGLLSHGSLALADDCCAAGEIDHDRGCCKTPLAVPDFSPAVCEECGGEWGPNACPDEPNDGGGLRYPECTDGALPPPAGTRDCYLCCDMTYNGHHIANCQDECDGVGPLDPNPPEWDEY